MLELGQIKNYTEYVHEIVFQKDRKIPFPLNTLRTGDADLRF